MPTWQDALRRYGPQHLDPFTETVGGDVGVEPRSGG